MGKKIGVLPSTPKSNALWVYFQMYSPLTTSPLAEGLLQAGVEFIADSQAASVPDTPGVQASKGSQDLIQSIPARKHQVLIERRLQRARVGDAQHRVRGLDVVGDARHAAPPGGLWRDRCTGRREYPG